MSSLTASENAIADQVGSSVYVDVIYILGASLFYGLSIPVFALSIHVLRCVEFHCRRSTSYVLQSSMAQWDATGQWDKQH
ncbi:hypothetical protein F5878DRAFT_660061 [Lentinula raphanica]|uniref:Uncharacterized protein n=1 Tax=Lentinula raphanica TaxID=153919 RepID=A0AA38PBT7_9AGAR|nr:hypothetical protein F5878DRAFT_660061 [Lentinula raphanica]